MPIKKVKFPNNTYQDINDARNVIIGDGINEAVSLTTAEYEALQTKDPNTLYVITDAQSGEENVIESITFNGASVPVTNKNAAITAYIENFYFVQGSSSQAGNATSGSYLSTKWEGTITGVTTPTDGLKVAYRIATNTGVGTAGAVLSIDGGTTYYPVVYNVNSVISTRYSVGSTILITFNSSQVAPAYLTSNTKTNVTGCWQLMDYDTNSYAYVREYQHGDDAAGTAPEYPLLARYNVTNKNGTYDTAYSRYHTGATLNTNTGALTATSFIKDGATSSQVLLGDGSASGLKTINNESILGSGNISISGGGSGEVKVYEFSVSDIDDLSDFTSIPVSTVNNIQQDISNSKFVILEFTTQVPYRAYFILDTDASSDDCIYFHRVNGSKVEIIGIWPSGSVDYSSVQNYKKPSSGIPKTDLASAVQTSLGKADTALQSYTETDPVYSASAAAGITSSDITNWNSKTSNVGTITGITMNGSSKGTSGVVNLGTVVTSETDPVFTASAAHGISSTDISNWNAKQKAITVSSSEPTSSQGSNGDIWIVI